MSRSKIPSSGIFRKLIWTENWEPGTENFQLQQQRRAASRDRLLLDREKDCGLVFDGATEAEPRGQRNSARGLRWNAGQVEDDQAKASAFEQQVGGAED